MSVTDFIMVFNMSHAALQKLGYVPASTVYLQSVIEEECTGNGALACCAKGYRADACIIPEPFAGSILSAQLGVMWFRVKVRGNGISFLETCKIE